MKPPVAGEVGLRNLSPTGAQLWMWVNCPYQECRRHGRSNGAARHGEISATRWPRLGARDKGWTRTAAPTVRVVSAGGLALGVALPSLSDGAGPGTAPIFDGLADNDDIRLQRLNICPRSGGGSARTASSMIEPVTLRS